MLFFKKNRSRSGEVHTLGGIGFCGLLGILFIALKLTGVIAWSWWWVLAPLWIPIAIVAGVCVSIILILLVVTVVAAVASPLTKSPLK